MFEFDLNMLDDNPIAEQLDPTPDNPLSPLDWLEIGFDRLLIPILAGMVIPVISRLFPSVTIPLVTIGTFAIPGIATMAYLSGPKNKFKWLFTLLAYVLGILCGSWDWLLKISLENAVTGSLVLFGSFCSAVALFIY